MWKLLLLLVVLIALPLGIVLYSMYSTGQILFTSDVAYSVLNSPNNKVGSCGNATVFKNFPLERVARFTACRTQVTLLQREGSELVVGVCNGEVHRVNLTTLESQLDRGVFVEATCEGTFEQQ